MCFSLYFCTALFQAVVMQQHIQPSPFFLVRSNQISLQEQEQILFLFLNLCEGQVLTPWWLFVLQNFDMLLVWKRDYITFSVAFYVSISILPALEQETLKSPCIYRCCCNILAGFSYLLNIKTKRSENNGKLLIISEPVQIYQHITFLCTKISDEIPV